MENDELPEAAAAGPAPTLATLAASLLCLMPRVREYMVRPALEDGDMEYFAGRLRSAQGALSAAEAALYTRDYDAMYLALGLLQGWMNDQS